MIRVEAILDSDDRHRPIEYPDGEIRFLVWLKPTGEMGWHDLLTQTEIDELRKAK